MSDVVSEDKLSDSTGLNPAEREDLMDNAIKLEFLKARSRSQAKTPFELKRDLLAYVNFVWGTRGAGVRLCELNRRFQKAAKDSGIGCKQAVMELSRDGLLSTEIHRDNIIVVSIKFYIARKEFLADVQDAELRTQQAHAYTKGTLDSAFDSVEKK